MSKPKRPTPRPNPNVVVLRASNVKYVASLTGETEGYLKEILERKAAQGVYAVHIPLDTRLFLRREGE